MTGQPHRIRHKRIHSFSAETGESIPTWDVQCSGEIAKAPKQLPDQVLLVVIVDYCV
jgi:hypothetical protein